MFKKLAYAFLLVAGLITTAHATDLPQPIIPANIVCDGVTDISTPLNAQILSLSNTGGGILKIPAGTCLLKSTIVLQTGVQLIGSGVSSTLLYAASTLSANDPMLETYDYSALVGGNTTGGPHDFAVKDMMIEGNSSGRGSGTGDGIDIYGFHYQLDKLQIFDEPQNAIASQWSTSSNVPVGTTNVGMEAMLSNLWLGQNGGAGMIFEGPHDSYITDSVAYLNQSYGMEFDGSDSYNPDGTWIKGVHTYGNYDTGIYIDGGITIYGVGVESESQLDGSDGIDVISSAFLATNVSTWNNGGTGLYDQNDGSGSDVATHISEFTAYGNGGYGLSVTHSNVETADTFTNVQINNNGSGGIYTCAGGDDSGYALAISDGDINSNSGYGITNCMYEVQYNNLTITNNDGGLITSNAYSNFLSSFTNLLINSNGTAGELVLGTLTLNNIQAMVYATSSEDTCWSGTIAGTQSTVNIQCAGGGIGSSVNIISGLVAGQTNVPTTTNTAVSATSGSTLSAADIIGGIITRSGPTSNFTDTTDTAANLIAAIPNYQVGTTFTWRLVNTTTKTETLDAGSGVTLPSAGVSIDTGDWESFSCLITSSSAVTCYSTGTGSN